MENFWNGFEKQAAYSQQEVEEMLDAAARGPKGGFFSGQPAGTKYRRELARKILVMPKGPERDEAIMKQSPDSFWTRFPKKRMEEFKAKKQFGD